MFYDDFEVSFNASIQIEYHAPPLIITWPHHLEIFSFLILDYHDSHRYR